MNTFGCVQAANSVFPPPVCFVLFNVWSPVFDSSAISNCAASSSFASPSFVLSPKPPIPASISIMSQFSTPTDSSVSTATTAISARPFVASVAGHVGGNGSPPEPGSTAALPVDLDKEVRSVWDFETIQKNGSTKADASWTCLHCNLQFKHWNTTKVLYHLTKVTGKDVRICKKPHDPEEKALYRSFLNQKDKSNTELKERKDNFEALVGE